MTTTTHTAETGTTLFIPLNRLKKSPRNVRKTPHPQADIEALAASIAAKGLLQNLVVEPELDGKGDATGYYLVTIGEGRRLAHQLRAKRKEIKKTEPVRCVIDTVHSAHEISLAENVIRSAMHPADQYEAFARDGATIVAHAKCRMRLSTEQYVPSLSWLPARPGRR
jgi:ParB family transcriptional regulator, chromosome partitioning protein